jgi:hypothetical protein
MSAKKVETIRAASSSEALTMKNNLLIKGLLLAASLPLLAGCVVYERPAPRPAVVVDDAPAPPPPQVEYVTVAPGPPDVWFWVPGGWEWRGRWVWVGGRWAPRPHPGAIWIGAHWGYRGNHRVWVRGDWR